MKGEGKQRSMGFFLYNPYQRMQATALQGKPQHTKHRQPTKKIQNPQKNNEERNWSNRAHYKLKTSIKFQNESQRQDL